MQRRKAEEINEEAAKEEYKKTAEKVNRRQPESFLCSQSQCSESLESRVDGRRGNRRRRWRMVEMERLVGLNQRPSRRNIWKVEQHTVIGGSSSLSKINQVGASGGVIHTASTAVGLRLLPVSVHICFLALGPASSPL